MQKKGIWIIVSVLVVLVLLLGVFGCKPAVVTPTTPAPTTPAPTTPKPTVTEVPAEVINLTWHNPFPPAGLNLAERWWMDEVERQTNGRVKFERIFGGTLGTLDQQPESIRTGSFDLGQVSCVYNPGAYPRSAVGFLPFVTDNVLAQYVAAHELFKSDLVKPDFEDLNQVYLMNGMWAQLQMMSYDPLTTIDDLRGVKIRGHGGSADALAAIGITTYGIPWEEYPAAAERRVVDAGIQGTPTDAYDFGFADIYKYWEDLVFYYFPMTLVINQDVWNSLPADIQQTMQNVSDIMAVQAYKLYHETEITAERAMLTEKGVQKIEFTEAAQLKEQGGPPVWADWIDEMNAQGLNGQGIEDYYFELLRFYGG